MIITPLELLVKMFFLTFRKQISMRMYYFLDKLMNIALPRVRDFRGVNPTAFDRIIKKGL